MSKNDLNIKEFLNIRLVLDRSGSMASCKEITIDSINSFLEDHGLPPSQKANPWVGFLQQLTKTS